MGYPQIIDMLCHRHLGPVHHLIGNARVIVIDNESIRLEIIPELLIEPQSAFQHAVESLSHANIKFNMPIWVPDILTIQLELDQHHKLS